MSGNRKISAEDRQAQGCKRGSGLKQTTLLLLALLLCPAGAQAAESVHEVYVDAVKSLGQYRENMNGRWFAIRAVRTYLGTKQTSHEQYTRGTYGVVLYADSLLYVNVRQLLSRSVDGQPISRHIETLVTGNWTISVDHHDEQPTLQIVDVRATGTSSLEHTIRRDVDITLRFEMHVQRKAAHEFARPRRDLANRLIVSLDREVYVRDQPGQPQNRQPKLEVLFAEGPPIRPAFVSGFELDGEGQRTQLALTDIRYTETADGLPILQRILTESSGTGDSRTVDDLIVCETQRPAWCKEPINISVPIGTRMLRHGATNEKTSQLPPEASHFVQWLGESEFKQHLSLQHATLESISGYVTSAEISPAETDVPSQQRDESGEKGLFALFLIGGIVLLILGYWLVSRFQSHDLRSASEH